MDNGRREDGSDSLESFFLNKVSPAIEGNHRRDAAHRAIGGFSMGGSGGRRPRDPPFGPRRLRTAARGRPLNGSDTPKPALLTSTFDRRAGFLQPARKPTPVGRHPQIGADRGRPIRTAKLGRELREPDPPDAPPTRPDARGPQLARERPRGRR